MFEDSIPRDSSFLRHKEPGKVSSVGILVGKLYVDQILCVLYKRADHRTISSQVSRLNEISLL